MESWEEMVVEAQMAMDASRTRGDNKSSQHLGQNTTESTHNNSGDNSSQDTSPPSPQSSQQEGAASDRNRTPEEGQGQILIGYLRHTHAVLDDPVSDEESESIQLPIQGVREDDEKPQEQGDAKTPSNEMGSEQQPHLRGGLDLEEEQPEGDDSSPQQSRSSISTPNPHARAHHNYT